MTSFKQTKLDQLKAEATATYKTRIDGYDAYATTCPRTLRPIGGWVIGAEVMVVVPYQSELIKTYIEYAKKGYEYKDTIPTAGSSAQILLTKPEKPIDLDGAQVRVQGVQYQSDDIAKIHTEVEAKYRAACEEADKAASQAEKDRIYAEALAEVELEEQAALAAKATERAAQIQARIAEKTTVKPTAKKAVK